MCDLDVIMAGALHPSDHMSNVVSGFLHFVGEVITGEIDDNVGRNGWNKSRSSSVGRSTGRDKSGVLK